MSLNVNQNSYIEQPFLLLSPSILMYLPFQSPFYFPRQLNAYYIPPQHSGTQEIMNFAGCKQSLPTKSHQICSYRGFIPKNGLLHQVNKIEEMNKNFKVFDLSNINVLPPQEKSNPKDLICRKHKRWTVVEDHLLCELRTNTKLSWKDIACKFPTRTLGLVS